MNDDRCLGELLFSMLVIGQRIEGRSHQSSAELESESGSGGMPGSREQDA